MTESSNKRQGRGEDEGMRLNTDIEIEKALHKVRLTGFLKCAGKRKGEAEGAQRGQISQLFFLPDKRKNQGDDWQPLSHTSGIGIGSRFSKLRPCFP